MFENKYGKFSEDGKEFIITNPFTPRPWFNYIWNEEYASLLSHTGGGFSFLETPRDNRLTRMRYNCLPWDRPGKYIYVKDRSINEFWSLSWAPTTDIKYDFYECHVGFGYSRIITEYKGIRAEVLYFVPVNLNVEVWKVKLENLTDKKRDLEIFSFTELLMGNALNDLINQPNDKHFTEISFNKNEQTLVATRRYWVLNKKVSVSQPNLDWKFNLYFTQNLPIKGFDSSLDSFIGRWRSEANPESVESGKMKNTEITAGDPCFALKSVVSLSPNNKKDFSVVMGIAPKSVKTPFKYLKWNDLKQNKFVDSLFTQLNNYWDKKINCFHVKTPDAKFDLMLNYWNKYQAAVTFDMARNSGYYHGGLLFGTGIRDQFQDILGVVISEPKRVRARLLNALRFQLADGSTLHNFFKLTDWGEKTNHSDTPLWIPFGLIEYLNETGDLSILDEIVTYYDGGKGSVYEHLKRALDFCISATTKRGIPKIMNGDWNDTLDKIGPEGKGETIWGAFFLAYCLQKTFELLELKKDNQKLIEWKKVYTKIGKIVNEVAWDGEWYIRAFKDNGEPVGTKKHSQGKIFINAQTWSVISGLAPKDRADQALNSLKKYLLKPNGVQICWPSYTKIEDNVGLISRCVPGKKENGAIFNHASSWAVLALLLNNEVDQAFDVYSRMLPINSAKRIDRYEIEPYVFAEYVTSPDHNTEGQASHSWLTGTAVWMLRIGLDYILGFRTSIKGIKIHPMIPSHWTSFYAERKFRGKLIKLNVKRISKSKNEQIFINGKKSDSSFIEIHNFKSKEINIEITIG